MSSLTIIKVLLVLTGLPALFASVVGLIQPSVYHGRVAPAMVPGVLAHDLPVLGLSSHSASICS